MTPVVRVWQPAGGPPRMLHNCGNQWCKKNGTHTCIACDDSGPPPGKGAVDPETKLSVCPVCGMPEGAGTRGWN